MSLRILVADDHDANRRALVDLLVHFGCRTVEAADGSIALRFLMESPFDLGLLDLHMPSLTGLQVLSQLRSAGVVVPSILMTGRPSSEVERAALELGALTMLRKPIAAAILRAALEQIPERPSGPEPPPGWGGPAPA